MHTLYEKITKGTLSVIDERERQDLKWGVTDHDLATWSVILGEQVGQLDREILSILFDKNIDEMNIAKIRERAVKSSAVALAIVDYIDRTFDILVSNIKKRKEELCEESNKSPLP